MAEVRFEAPDVALRAHRDRWRELAVERSNAFVTPEWFEAWSAAYGEGSGSRVAVVTEGDRVIGLIPLAVEGSGPLRVTRIAGANLADLLHPVAAAADEDAVAAATLAALAAERGGGAIVLDNVDGDAAWWQGAPGLRAHPRAASPGPYVSLAGLDWDGYLQQRSSSFRKRLRQIERGLAREAEIAFRLCRDEGDATAGMATFFDLHYRRWAERGGSSLSAERARAFHLDFAAAAARRGWLRLWIVEADGEPIAASYGWRVGERQAFYQSGLDDRFARHSVGLLLQAHAIREAIAEGAREYDMLLGDEGYKGRFCDRSRDLRTVALTRPRSLAGAAIAAELAGRRAVRALPEGPRDRVRGALRSLNARLPTGRRR